MKWEKNSGSQKKGNFLSDDSSGFGDSYNFDYIAKIVLAHINQPLSRKQVDMIRWKLMVLCYGQPFSTWWFPQNETAISALSFPMVYHGEKRILASHGICMHQ
jgi:hypothetical protein